MKLLELCLSPGHGGLELYADKVIRHYHERGGCLAVVRPGGLIDRRLAEAGIPREHLPVAVRAWPWLAARRLARLVDREGIDVVHMHWRGDLALAALARTMTRRPVRLVYTRQMALTRPKLDPYHRFLYRQVDAFLCITRRLAEDARRFLPLPPERIHVLYYGVPAAGPAPCEPFLEELGWDGNGFRVALFGRVEPGKGQHLLVEAVRRLRAQGLDVRAALVGHVMDRAYVDGLKAEVARAGLHDAVVFRDFIPEPQRLMGCFHAVVLASREETFGLVLPEAMRAGVAVVGSRAGGVPEIIDHERTGLMFESGDAGDLARCLERLARDPALRGRLAAAGKAEADARFSEEAHFRRLEAFLDTGDGGRKTEDAEKP